jgi:hypothetical protein
MISNGSPKGFKPVVNITKYTHNFTKEIRKVFTFLELIMGLVGNQALYPGQMHLVRTVRDCYDGELADKTSNFKNVPFT